VPHWPTAHDDDPSAHVTQAFPQSAAAAHVEASWQHERHAGATQRPLIVHQANPASQTPEAPAQADGPAAMARMPKAEARALRRARHARSRDDAVIWGPSSGQPARVVGAEFVSSPARPRELAHDRGLNSAEGSASAGLKRVLMKRLIGVLALLAAGCGAHEVVATQVSAAVGDGGADRGHCHADLSTSTCPATWEQAEIASCAGVRFGEGLGHAGDDLAFGDTSSGFGAYACYYDPTSHALVGAWSDSDINEYCDHTSFDVLFGDVPATMTITRDIGTFLCTNDGGASDTLPVR
jgi:hypothetical protein